MAADRRMVAKHLVLHGGLAGSNRIEEVCLMRRYIAVACGRGKSLGFVRLVVERRQAADVPLPTAPDTPCAAVPASPFVEYVSGLGVISCGVKVRVCPMISMVPLVPWNLIGSPPALFRLQRSTRGISDSRKASRSHPGSRVRLSSETVRHSTAPASAPHSFPR